MITGFLGQGVMNMLWTPTRTVSESRRIRYVQIFKYFRQNRFTKTAKVQFDRYQGWVLGVRNFIRRGSTFKDSGWQALPRSCNIHDVHQFLGLSDYYRKFIGGYGEIARRLPFLLQKDSTWQWSDKEDQAFILLKDRFMIRLVLAFTILYYCSRYRRNFDTVARICSSTKTCGVFQQTNNARGKHLRLYELETLSVVCLKNNLEINYWGCISGFYWLCCFEDHFHQTRFDPVDSAVVAPNKRFWFRYKVQTSYTHVTNRCSEP